MVDIGTVAAYATMIMFLLGLGAGILAVGYLRYETRVILATRPPAPPPGPDPMAEYARLGGEIQRGMAEAQKTLDATREAVRHGIRG